MSAYKILNTIVSGLLSIVFRVEIIGRENIPTEGGLIVCANHKSLLDPVVVSKAVTRRISFMAKKQLFDIPVLKTMLGWVGAFPVDRDGSDLKAIKTSLRILKGGDVLGIFPEGTRVKEGEKGDVKAGIAVIAMKTKVPVLPVSIDTKYTPIFGKLKITIGKPMTFEDKYGEKLTNDEYKEISEQIMESVYSNIQIK